MMHFFLRHRLEVCTRIKRGIATATLFAFLLNSAGVVQLSAFNPLSVPKAEAGTGIFAPINYQGRITGMNGTAVADGKYNVRFKIFNAAIGGSPLWSETWSGANQVSMTGGLFSVALGTQVAMTGSVDFNTNNLFLQIEFDPANAGTYPEVFSPRRQFGSVPYAHNSDLLDGLDATKFVRTDIPQTMSGTLTIKPNNNATLGLKVIGTASGTSIHADQSLTASGNIVAEGTISGANLYIGTGIQGAGLTNCNTASSALQWNSSTGRFSCGTITGSSFSTGNVLTIGNAKYVSKQGDTMTGALTINMQGGTLGTIGLRVLNTLSGAIIHAEKSLTSSGTIFASGNIRTKGTLSGAALTVLNGTSYILGNLGIGNTTPGSLLDIGTRSGSQEIDISLGANSGDEGRFVFKENTTARMSLGYVGGSREIRITGASTLSANALLVIPQNGGIVVNAPLTSVRAAFEVKGTISGASILASNSLRSSGTLIVVGNTTIRGSLSGSNIHAEKGLSASGNITTEGTISGANLYVGTGIQGAGLTNCNTASSALQWNSSTGRFSCGTITGSSFSTGNVLTIGNAKYVSKQGDTMTGALTINVQGGNNNTIGLRVANTISGSMIHAEKNLTVSGSITTEGTISGANLFIGTGITGAGLSTCSNTTTSKLLWNSATGRFSCGTDFGTNFGSGQVIAIGDTRYVRKSGDTMTGALVINIQGGTLGSIGLKVLNTLSGAIIHAEKALTSSGFIMVTQRGTPVGSGALVVVNSTAAGTGAYMVANGPVLVLDSPTQSFNAPHILFGYKSNFDTALWRSAAATLSLNGTLSGHSLYADNTIRGAGLTDCDGTSSKLLWDATTGRFSCGTDGGGTGGNFVSIGGDTMTGTLVVPGLNLSGITLSSINGFSKFLNIDNGGLATAGITRLTQNGNLTNIGSIQAGSAVFTAGGTFPTTVDYAATNNIYAVAVGDIDGDGDKDVVTGTLDGQYSKFLNNGNGTFGSRSDFATGGSIYGITLTDVNGDGMLDVAAADGSDMVIQLNNGDGTFASKVSYAASYPINIAASDLNGDGRPDIAVAENIDSSVSIYINNGDGTFAPKVDLNTAIGHTFDTEIADINGDGYPDILATVDAGVVSTFLNRGNGTFHTKVDVTTQSAPVSLAVNDINGDGAPDMVVNSSTNTNVSVHMNNGDGTFATKVDYAVSTTNKDLRLVDINGDGVRDIVMAGVIVLINKGRGTFDPKIVYNATGTTFTLETGDLNGDGKEDIVSIDNAGDNMTVMLNSTRTIMTIQPGTGGVVGIGTTTPGSKLAVSGSVIISTSGKLANGRADTGVALEVQGTISGSTIYAARSLRSSGSIVAEGTISGANLYVGTSLQGAGLVDCQNGVSSKLLWNASTGRFSCGTDQTGGSGTGNILAIGNQKYVSKQGDTMTGALVINMQGGNLNTIGLKVLNTMSGAIIHAEKLLTSSGTIVTESGAYIDGNTFVVQANSNRVGIGIATPNTALHVHSSGNTQIQLTSDTTGNGVSQGAMVGLNGAWMEIKNYDSSFGGPIAFYNNSNMTMLIKSNMVGINTTADNAALEVLGTISGSIIHANSALRSSGTLIVEGITTLNSTVNVAGNILPTATNTYDLGSNTLRFRDLYLSGSSLHVGTSGNEGTVGYNTAGSYLTLGTSGQLNAFTILNSNGFVGIGTNNADSKLEVIGTISGSTIYAANALRSSGSITAEGAISGASIYAGTSIKGAGLVDCSTAGTSKLLWNSSTGRFSCGTDQGGSFSTGNVLTIGNQKYVSKQGDTMTGTLNIRPRSATGVGLNVAATMSGRSLQVTGTGSKPLLYTDVKTGRVGINTATPQNTLDILGSGAVSLRLARFNTGTGMVMTRNNDNSFTLTNMTGTPATATYSVDFGGETQYGTITNGFTNTIKGDDTYSVSLWFNSDTFGAPGGVLIDASGLPAQGFWVEYNGSNGFYWANNGVYRTYTTATLSANTWYHLAVVKTGAGDSGNLYLNGVLQNTYSGTLGNTSTTNSDFLIGKYRNSGYTMDGRMDDLRIYNTALNATDIGNIYNGGAGSLIDQATGLVGWWKFDEGTGSTAADSSGNGLSMNLSGSPSWVTGKIPAATVYQASTLIQSTDSLDPTEKGIAKFGDQQGNTSLQGRTVKFYTYGGSNIERMRITSGGLLGLGTSTPGSKLSVSGATLINAKGTANATAKTGLGLEVIGGMSGSFLSISNNLNVTGAILSVGNITTRGIFSGATVYATKSLRSSGSIVAEGAISGASLYIGTSIRGAGLVTDCNTSTSALQWSSSTGRFSCGTISAGGTFSTGNVLTIGNQKYVSKQGDTMTGVLNIRLRSSTGVGLNVAGTMSGRSLQVTGTGSQPLLYTDVKTGRIGIGTNSPSAPLTISGSTNELRVIAGNYTRILRSSTNNKVSWYNQANTPAAGAGYAVQYNGSNAYSIANLSAAAYTNLSLSFWVKRTAGSGTKGIMQWANSLSNVNPFIYLHDVSGTLSWYVNDNYNLAGGTLTDGVWTQIVLTWDGTTWKSYLNGSQVATYTGGAGIHQSIGTKLYMGQGAAGYWNGAIDEVKAYNTALSAADVTADYNSGNGVYGSSSLAGLTGGWHYEENTGTNVADFSTGGANAATLNGGITWTTSTVALNASPVLRDSLVLSMEDGTEAAEQNIIYLGGGAGRVTLQGQTLRFFTNSIERARFSSGGLLGLGTTTPGSKLSVSGSTIIGQSIGTRAAKTGLGLEVIGGMSGSFLSISNNLNVTGAILSVGNITTRGIFSGATVYATKSLRSSGSIVAEGTISGANLYVGTGIQGAGLTNCNTASSALQWNSSTGRFSCGTITGSAFSTGNVLTIGNAKYVSKQGDTMTGALTINMQGGTLGTIGLRVLNTMSGAIIHAEKSLTSSGAIVAAGNISTKGSLSGAALNIMNGTSYILGNLGIGTVSPSAPLHIKKASGTAELRLDVTAGNGSDTAKVSLYRGGSIQWDVGVNTDQNGDNNFSIKEDGDWAKMRLVIQDATGNIGVGTTTPTEKLEVIGTISGSTVYAANTLRSSGSIVAEGTISGANLYVGTGIQGAGLVDCQNGVSSKLLWNATTGRFSCGTDQSGSSGMSQAAGDIRYVSKQGDTMTGALTINMQGGNLGTIGLEVINSFSGAQIHAEKNLTASGGLIVVGDSKIKNISFTTSTIYTNSNDLNLIGGGNNTTRGYIGLVNNGGVNIYGPSTGLGAQNIVLDNRSNGGYIILKNANVGIGTDTPKGRFVVVGSGSFTAGLSGSTIHAEKSLTSSGTIVAEGAISGASLYIGTSIQGAGLVSDCNSSTSALQWTAATGRFSCGTISAGGSFSTGNVLTIGNVRYVELKGDSMTGSLQTPSINLSGVLLTSLNGFNEALNLNNAGLATNGITRLQPNGNLTNIGSIQSGEINATMGGTFAAKRDYTVGSSPWGLAIGDLDGDGKQDIAIANSASTSVSVLINTGTGTYRAKVDYTTGTTPYSVALADFNGDGRLDMAVPNNGSSTVSILMNTGNGTFGTKVDYTTGTAPLSSAVGDVNGDGKPDLVVSNYNGATGTTASVFINNGNGTFATKVDYTTGTGPRGMVLADLNGDGKLDLAVTNQGGSNLSVLMNNGNGTFATKVDYTTGTNPTALAAGDLNGDGKADLATANANGTSTSVLMNNGNGTFATKVDYTVGGGPFAIAIGDINGDGKADLAVTNGSANTVSYLQNNGNGTFATKVDYTTAAFAAGLGIADLNGDGKMDMAVGTITGGVVSVFLNNVKTILYASAGTGGTVGIGTSTPNAKLTVSGSVLINNRGQVNNATTDSGVALEVVGTISGSNIYAARSLRSSGSIVAEGAISGASLYIGTSIKGAGLVTDCNGASSALQWTASTGRFSCGTISGGATFGSGNVLTIGNARYVQIKGGSMTGSLQTPSINLSGVLLTSMNGFNEALNLNNAGLATNGITRISPTGNLQNIGTIQSGEINAMMGGVFGAKTDNTTGTSPRNVAVGDLNGDSKADIAVVNSTSTTLSIFLNNGAGTFASKVDYATGTSPYAVAIGDMNGDGRMDIVVGNNGGSNISVFMNKGSGTFTTKVDYSLGGSPESIALGDFNGDGKLDVVAPKSSTATVGVFLNLGNGTLGTRIDYGVGSNPLSVAVGDVNGDGKPDLAVANQSSTNVSVLINSGTGGFLTKADYTTATNPTAVAIGDVNGDGKADLAVANLSSNSVSVLINAGAGTFLTKVDYTTGSSPRSVVIADLNGDGRADIATANNGATTFSVLMNNGGGKFAAKADYTASTSPYSIAVGDMNGDGKLDVAVTNQGTTTVSVFLNLARSIFFASAGTGGTVGIGTTTPGSKLAVSGSVLIGNSIANRAAKAQLEVLGAISGVTLYANQSLRSSGSIVAEGAISGASLFIGTSIQGAGLASCTTTGQALQWNSSTGRFSCSTVSVTGYVAIKGAAMTGSLETPTINLSGVLLTSMNGFNEALNLNNAGLATYGVTRLTANGNLTNIGSIQSGEINATMGGTFLAKRDYTSGTQPYAIAMGDLNGDGKPDLATANLGTTTTSVFINTGTGTYRAKADYTVGSGPEGVTIADFNGDGKNDLAVCNNTSNTVSVLMNTGNGIFATKVDYTAVSNPQSIASGDVNGDGKPDLVTANQNGASISVFLNNGNGTFSAKTDYTTGTNPDIVVMSDFNGDGRLDIAVTNLSSTSVSVFMNKGNGTFAAKADYTTGSSAAGLAAGDVSGDGKADMIVTNAGSTSMSVFINNGDGTFATKVDYTTGSTPYTAALGDVNGDGRLDAITADWGGSTASVFINKGNGTFNTRVAYTTGASPWAIAIGDVNSDGKADFATANYSDSTISVLLNNPRTILYAGAGTGGMVGIGTASPGSKLSVSGSVIIGNNIANRAAKASAQLEVIGAISGTTIFANQSLRSSGSIVAEGAISGASLYIGTSIKGAGLVTDCNGASSALQWTASTGRFSCGTISGGGTFGSGNVLTIGNARYVELKGDSMTGSLQVPTVSLSGVVLTSLNGYNEAFNIGAAGLAVNGITRISPTGNLSNIGTIQSGEITVSGGGTFGTKTDYTAGSGPYGIALGDFSGDGKLDAVVTNQTSGGDNVFINTGTGTFRAKAVYTNGSGPQVPAIADFNGDGRLDFATVNQATTTASVFINSGTGGFMPKVDYTVGSTPYSIAAGDVNRDGKPDLIVANFTSGTISVLMNNGNGTFAAKTDYTVLSSLRSVALADMNGDGKLDIAVSNSTTSVVSILMNTGTGGFRTRIDTALGTSSAMGIAAGDVNGDGKPDIAVASYNSNVVTVLLNSGTGGLSTKTNYATAANPYMVAIGDVNGDGKADLAVADGGVSSASVFINKGNGTFNTKVDYTTGASPRYIALGDLNSDGLLDIATANFSDGTMSVLLNQPTTSFYASTGTGGYVAVGTKLMKAKVTIINTVSGGTGAYIYSSGAVLALEASTQSGARTPNIAFGYRGNFDTRITRTATGSLTFASNTGTLITLDTERSDATGNVFQILSDVNTGFGTTDENRVFRIQANGATYTDSSYNSFGADYAEWFYSGNEKLKAGEVVCIDITKNNAVKRCTGEADSNVMGIVSTNPAFVGNTISGADGIMPPGYALIGLIGQVPAHVIVEGTGAIRPGDALTPASKPGYARKARAGESTVGVALEGLASGEGIVNVLISRRNSSMTVDAVGQKVLDTIASMKIGDEVQLMVASSLQNLNVDDQIQTEVRNQVSNLKSYDADIQSLQMELDDMKHQLSLLQSQTGSTTIVTTTGSALAADLTAATLVLEQTLTTGGDARVGGDLHIDGTLMASSLFVPNGLTIDGGTTVTGTMAATTITASSGATIDGTLTVNGNIRVHSGALLFDSGATVHLPDLIVEKSLMIVGNITIQGMAEFFGNVVIHGELILSNKQAGFALIPKTGTSVTVLFGSGGLSGMPVVTASPDVPMLYGVSHATQTGFTIRLAGPATEDVRFSWIAIVTDNALTQTGAVAIRSDSTVFPMGSDNIPVSSDMFWNACIRNTTLLDADGKPHSCARYHEDFTWHQPDLLIDFLWNTNMTPPLLIVPSGYTIEVTESEDSIRGAFSIGDNEEAPQSSSVASSQESSEQTSSAASVEQTSSMMSSEASSAASIESSQASETSESSIDELTINPVTPEAETPAATEPAPEPAPEPTPAE